MDITAIVLIPPPRTNAGPIVLPGHLSFFMRQLDPFLLRPLLLQMVRDAQKLKVVEVVEKEDRKSRPSGLNTVELLKVGGWGWWGWEVISCNKQNLAT